LSVKLCTEILQFHIKDQKKAERISYHLNSDYPSHNYPIMLREAKRIGLKVKALDLSINDELLELNELYSEMGQRAQTDFDELNYHNNEIINIIESANMQIYYQIDKDTGIIAPRNGAGCRCTTPAPGARSSVSERESSAPSSTSDIFFGRQKNCLWAKI